MLADKRIFHALDLDRTLFNTALLSEQLESIVAVRIPGFETELHDQMAAHIQRGDSFFIFEYFVSKHGLEALQACIEELRQKVSPEGFLMPGAKERLAFAASQPGWSVGILTYGSSITQSIKIALAGLQGYPHLITDTPRKSEVIATWQQLTGDFLLPEQFGGQTVDLIILDDDKLSAFEGLPENTLGNWLTADTEASAKIKDTLKHRVHASTDLSAVVALLQAKLT